MKLNKLLLLVLLFLASINTIAQLKDYSVKYGLQTHLLHPRTEFDNETYRLSLLGRGFIKLELNKYFEAEFGTGIGELNGQDYNNENWTTNIFPTDFRVIFSPLTSETINPYVFGGVGLLKWYITNLPSSRTPERSKEKGWNVYVPVGYGIEFALSSKTILDISGGYSFALTDDLNYYKKKTTKDGYLHFGIGLTFAVGGGLTDVDNDGLTENYEISIGTDPNNKDSDNDRLLDGCEINKYKTNPLMYDTDSDGLSDFEEIKIHNTDPLSVDTDGDDILDYEELSKYKSSPHSKDSDGDGLSDGYEINKYKTNPADKDTDGDLLIDSDEIKKYKTDPNLKDTDSDGLTDGEEINIFKTNPLLNDSEGNGIFDSLQHKPPVKLNIEKLKLENLNEVSFSSSDTVTFHDINFEIGQADIPKDAETQLLKVYNELKNNNELELEIRGYSDNTGKVKYNNNLSQKRANSIRLWFVKKGIDALRLTSKGYGETSPKADNNTESGRKLNRRIEFVKISK